MLSSTVAHAQQCASYGGIGNGIADNTATLNAAVAALPASGGCIAFPPGKYRFNSALSYTPSNAIYSLTLVGAGANNTTLYWPGTNGITLNYTGIQQTIHVRDLTFSTGDSTGSYVGLTLKNSNAIGISYFSDITRTNFRGDDGGAQVSGSDYWGVGVNVLAQSNINFDTDEFWGLASGSVGTGISLSGNTSVYNGGNAGYGVIYNIAKCGFWWNGNGIQVVTLVQGVSITQSNFTNGTTGIWLKPSGTGFDELAVTGGNQFNTKGNQITIEQPFAHLIVSGNLFFVQANLAGIYIDINGWQNTIVNNAFYGLSNSGSIAIYVGGSNPSSVATGNMFNNLNIGVDLAGTSGWNVQANSYGLSGSGPVTTHVANIGSPGANSVGVATD